MSFRPDDAQLRRLGDRRLRSLALVLPLAGLGLLMPPFVMVFAAEATILGAPLVAVYIFAVWAGLIFAAWRLSGRLLPDEAPPAPPLVRPPADGELP